MRRENFYSSERLKQPLKEKHSNAEEMPKGDLIIKAKRQQYAQLATPNAIANNNKHSILEKNSAW